MPVGPYPISGTVLDRDGSTAVSGATIIVFNVTSNERISTTSASNGNWIVDIANLASGYTNGDKLQVTAFYGSGSAIRSLSRRHTVDTGIGSYDIGNMVLHAGMEPFGSCDIVFASHSNSHSSGLYVDFYDRNDGFVLRIEAGAGETYPLPIGYLGIRMDAGFIRIFEDETSGRSEVVTKFK